MPEKFLEFETDDKSTEGLIFNGSTQTFESKGRRKQFLIAGAVVLVLAAALTIGLVLGLRKSKDNESGPGSSLNVTGESNSSTPMVTESPQPTSTSPTGTGVPLETCFGLDDDEANKCPWSDPPLIVISLDGFRAQYLQRHLTPTLERLRECGVHTPYMRSVYPTLTFPNHYTIMTGLYPESHGIVNNVFYDQHINQTFILGRPNTANPAWWGGEPVWVTARKQNVTTATYFWVGSDFQIQGMRPNYYFPYNGSVLYEERVDQALAWLDMPDDQRPKFITLYFDEPDHTGHASGPDSDEENQQLKRMDGIIKRLTDGLMSRDLGHCVNLVIVADHGMTETSCEREVLMKCFFDVEKTWITDGTIAAIDQRFHQTSVAGGSSVVVKTENPLSPQAIKDSLECETNHYRVFTKDTLPKRFHYANNDRIGDVIVDVQDGWLVYGKNARSCLAGNHGYDNLDKNMQALFVGFGPSFKHNIQVEPFENIELYNMFCVLLGIQPAPNNGTFGSLHHLLSQPIVLTEDVRCVNKTQGIPSCACRRELFTGVDATVPCADVWLNGSVHKSDPYTVLYSSDYHMPIAAVMRPASRLGDSLTLSPTCNTSNRNQGSDGELSMYLNYSSPVDNITLASLIPVSAYLEHCGQSSPTIPMYEGFKSGIWQHAWKMINSYLEEDSAQQIVSGAIFDSNHDGRPDPVSSARRFVGDSEVPVPSHYFVSIARCKDTNNISACGNPEALSFVLPHIQSVPNCLDYQTYLMDNVARVKDIELLTGLQIFGYIPLETRVQLEVRLPTSLWNTSLPTGNDSNKTVRNDSTCISDSKYQPVLLVSLDGFRAHYLSYNVTPNIQRLINEGVHAERLLSAYPSLTFPNHYTIATGLYPESHGIVDNKLFDTNLWREYNFESPGADDPVWYGGDPIWLTAKRQGKKTASYFWVGSDVAINGGHPDYYFNYSNSVNFSSRVKQMMDWVSMPAGQRPDFSTLYFDEPDSTGHAHGPDPGPEMLNTLRMVDGIIGELLTGLENRNLYDKTNLMIVSDHGMSSRSCDRIVKMDDYFTQDEINKMYVYTSAAGRISNKYTYSNRMYVRQDAPLISTDEIMSRLEGKSQHHAVYLKSQLPKRLHYANNIRIDDIIVKMEDQWIFSRFSQGGSSCQGGTHGWDPRYPSMGGLFVAHGPAFKEGLEVAPFENIEIYGLISDLLNITASPNNGTRGSLYHILKNPPTLHKASHSRPFQSTLSVPQSAIRASCNCSAQQLQKTSLLFRPQPSTFLQPTTLTDSSAMILSYEDHVTAYSSRLHMPLWTSFLITSGEDEVQDGDSCVVPDSNIPTAERSVSESYRAGITAAPVFTATNSECGKVTYSSAVVPMTEELKNDLWKAAQTYIGGLANASRPIAVVSGPIFDYNSDGLADNVSSISRFADEDSTIFLPSHYYIIYARCLADGQELPCGGDLDLLSFVLPNDQTKNGQSVIRRLLENVARVRDVELLTGLSFLDLPELDPAKASQLSTHVPMSLWTGGGSWKDQPCPGSEDAQCPSSYRPVLLISLDGFRADYLVKYNKTPAIDRLSQCGVHAPYMRSVYPTKTFPNHYTIVTGLYPESHGIIDNNMYDLKIGQKFTLSSTQSKNPAWWGGEPFWLTAQRQGHRAATYFWPGSEVKIAGQYPNFWRNYSDGDPFPGRVDTVLEWLMLPEDQRPDFLTLYFNEPDHTGHQVGPDSPLIGEKLALVDSMIDRLMTGLYSHRLQYCVNVIIVADHGMSGLSCERQVVLSADISPADLGNVNVYEGPVGRISTLYKYGSPNNVPMNPPKVNVSDLLERLECSTPHMLAFTKDMLPLRHHYTNNDRIDQIILDGDDGWTISRTGTSSCSGGNHGYDNLYASMHALFLAHGPAFKTGVTVEPFENIELHNLFAHLVGVTPAPNNGTEGSLYHLLVSPPSVQTSAPISSPVCSNHSLSGSETAQTDECQCSTAAVKENLGTFSNPLGDPVAASDGPDTCTLKWSDRNMGYDSRMKAPAWVSYTLRDANFSSTAQAPCVARDPWFVENSLILNSSTLLGTQYQPAALHFSYNEPCSAVMASEVVPMLSEFKKGVWKELKELVAHYSGQYREISVTAGPVYDYSTTGKWRGLTNETRLIQDTFPVPTHLFLVMARCADASTSLPCWDSVQLLSFLIPHRPSPSNCQTLREMLRQNVARVRDVEIATGLRFFSQLSLDQAARLRTFLPTELWEDSLVSSPTKPGHWIDQPCPDPNHADSQCPSGYRPVLLVSLDGFKPQYLHRGFSPVIDRLVTCGVHAPYMRSVYPTKTFPNHYTIATGLYPESHGIIDNTMFDANIRERFSISSDTKNDARWWDGEPIWITAERQNVTSASYFWVGSDVGVQGSYPDLFKYYAEAVPFSARVDTVVEWLMMPADKRPGIAMLYFDEPDHQAHTSGPFTPEVDEQIQRVDSILGHLMDSLYQNDLHHCVNLVLVSDHGFSHISCDEVVELHDYFNQTEEDQMMYYYLGPFGRIANTYRRNKDSSITVFNDTDLPFSVQDIQERLNCTNHMRVYNKLDLPKRHHYVNNARIDNVILDLDLNYTVTNQLTSSSRQYCTGGSHGWDNLYRAMNALFVGYGPVFKNGLAADAFENIELYNMISDILGITPAPNNGTEGSLDYLLWQTFNRSREPVSFYSASGSATSALPCNCSFGTQAAVSVDVQNVTDVNASALPYGAPLLMQNKVAASLLYQPSHVTAYNTMQNMPLWVSATVTNAMQTRLAGNLSCPLPDPRVNGSECGALLQHHDSNVTMTSLLPSGFDLGETASLSTSMVPMSKDFKTEIWQPLQDYIVKWASDYQAINVMAGPVFDTNSDGLVDGDEEIRFRSSKPTHLFIILSHCNDTSQSSLSQCSKIQTLSFILPQDDNSRQFNCQSIKEYLVDNEARVRDVELITGLHFFPDLPFTQAVAMRTYLPSGLWPTTSV